MILGLFAWWLYEDGRAERSLLNAVVASVLLAFAVFGVVLPSLNTLFPSAEIARALRYAKCVKPKLASAGFHEPSLVFMTDTETALTDGSGAADFLGQGSCRFALIEQRSERAFVHARRGDRVALRRRDPDRGLQHLPGQAGLDLDLPVRRHGMMGVPTRIGETQPYAAQLFALIGRSAAQLVRTPAAPHRP